MLAQAPDDQLMWVKRRACSQTNAEIAPPHTAAPAMGRQHTLDPDQGGR